MHDDTTSKEGEIGKLWNLQEEPWFQFRDLPHASKVAQYRLMAENRREKEEAKKETAKKIATPKLHIQQKRYEAFQKFQDSMKSLLSSPTEELMLINLVNLSLKHNQGRLCAHKR